jgi:hypothetical protein
MAYESIDKLQNLLASSVFHYTKDAKKASGRALGTLVEVVTFYLLKAWGFEHSTAIETSIPEYGNPDITHNVEYSLHPILIEDAIALSSSKLPVTSSRIFSEINQRNFPLEGFTRATSTLLSSDRILRNSCVVANGTDSRLLAFLDKAPIDRPVVAIVQHHAKPYAIFECKRVGVEEGMKKGPQTIEKAKQGAYVAKSISSLHKLRDRSGTLRGLIYTSDLRPYTKTYQDLLAEIVSSDKPALHRDFILTVGIVSNHGNWFTSENHNKELKVLAQSYDWLLFLTDEGLAEFITDLLLRPQPLLRPARKAFLASYSASKKGNRFTKVRIDYDADQVLQAFFRDNLSSIESWFNVIAPKRASIHRLRDQVSHLRGKNWRGVHNL